MINKMFKGAQLEAITYNENKNILVAAAAGSGKTTVLVERIFSLISGEVVQEANIDNENSKVLNILNYYTSGKVKNKKPIDIERILVMTFTNEAAASMKKKLQERIAKEVSYTRQAIYIAKNKNLSIDGLESRLQLLSKELTHSYHANISTIHGFCGDVIKKYFYTINLDPSFRIADEKEVELIRNDVLTEVLEEEYKEGNEDFENLVIQYCKKTTDDELIALINKVFYKIMGQPNPLKWLRENIEKTIDKKEIQKLLKYKLEDYKENIRSFRDDVYNMADKGSSGIKEYENWLICREALDLIIKHLNKIEKENIEEIIEPIGINEKLKEINLRKKTEDKDSLKLIREELQNISDEISSLNGNEIIKDCKNSYYQLKTIYRIVEKYIEEFNKAKRDKNIIDFNDMEHFVIEILGINKEKTKVCDDLKNSFDYIFVDEYQDTNLTQEAIIKSISNNNVFMVGDNKQSIYRFRNAEPRLFNEKEETYEENEKNGKLIRLNTNYRSKAHILEGINQIFFNIMKKENGGIEYNEKVKLNPKEGDEPLKETSSFHILKELPQEDIENQEFLNLHKKLKKYDVSEVIEPYFVGKKILEIIKLENYKLSDFCILLRDKSSNEVFMDVLRELNISSKVVVDEGFYDTIEIQTIVNYLRICHNSHNDISLSAVLKSPIVGLSNNELGLIRIYDKKSYFIENIYSLINCNIKDIYKEKYCNLVEFFEFKDFIKKIEKFIDLLNNHKIASSYLSISNLIINILNETNYMDIVSSMKNGNIKVLNLKILISQARDYEKTSFKGLYNFINYINYLRENEIDMGQSNLIEDLEDKIRIMTIHGSKGLEFPVVFVSGLQKRFNDGDLKADTIINSRYGIGQRAYYNNISYKVDTIISNYIKSQEGKDLIGEEERLLYVALTRAKERLIITGINKDNVEDDDYFEKLKEFKIKPSSSRIKLLLSGIIGNNIVEHFENKYRVINWDIFFEDINNIDEDIILEKNQDDSEIIEFKKLEYKNNYLNSIPNKLSVSEIKELHMEEVLLEIDKDDVKQIKYYLEEKEVLPKFMTEKKEKKLSGASLGTAYHNIFEKLDLKTIEPTIDSIKQQLDNLVENYRIEKIERTSINENKVLDFIKSKVGREMIEAEKQGLLSREKPFVMALPSTDERVIKYISKKTEALKPIVNEEEKVIIQGIIDAYYEKDGNIVLVDYKTDSKTLEELVELYKTQLLLYRDALEKTLGKEVNKIYIYSVKYSKEVEIMM